MKTPHNDDQSKPADFTIMVTLPTGEAVDLLTEAGVPVCGSAPTVKEQVTENANSN